MNNLNIFENITTMSSLEISELTGKEHRNVLADIRNMLNELAKDAADFSAAQKYGNNNTREIFNLPKRETLILVSGYNIKMRAAIIDRWEYLETQERERIKQLIESQQKELTDKDTLIFINNKQINKLQKKVIMYQSNPKYEKTYQAWLNDIVDGQREVRVGTTVFKDKRKQKRIDILTPYEIFECKHASQWEKAITQVTKYQTLMEKDGTYVGQNLIVFLFEESDEYEEQISFIRDVAAKSNVRVFYHKNLVGYYDADELDSNDNNEINDFFD